MSDNWETDLEAHKKLIKESKKQRKEASGEIFVYLPTEETIEEEKTINALHAELDELNRKLFEELFGGNYDTTQEQVEEEGKEKAPFLDGFPGGEIADRYAQVYGSERLGWLVEDGAEMDDIWDLANKGNRKISSDEELGQWLESLSQEELAFIRKLLGGKQRPN